MNQEVTCNDSNVFLFDRYKRTDRSVGLQTESAFEFFNRSAWQCAEAARATLELWFANVPNEKKADLRGRFRGNDRRHPSALLELVTHEILRSVASDVQVEPHFHGGQPDFSAFYKDTKFVTECTVVQESDVKFGALQREKVVLDVIDSIDAGSFRLMVHPLSTGNAQPSGSALRGFLQNWLVSVNSLGQPISDRWERPLESTVWEWQDWKLRFDAIPMNSQVDGGAIGGRVSEPQSVVGDSAISRALKKKAEKYGNPGIPYLVVVAEKASLAEPTVIRDVLFGPKRWLPSDVELSVQPRQFYGFFGAPSQPRNQHVSAVLYKRSLRNAWDICGQMIGGHGDYQWQPIPEWYLLHNPFTNLPLPEGILPFATEFVWRSGKMELQKPTRTLNDVLGLPDPWPGEEH